MAFLGWEGGRGGPQLDVGLGENALPDILATPMVPRSTGLVRRTFPFEIVLILQQRTWSWFGWQGEEHFGLLRVLVSG